MDLFLKNINSCLFRFVLCLIVVLFVQLSTGRSEAMNSNTMKLYELAMNKFGKITKGEMAFFQAVANAEHVSYKKEATDEPIIRASCIAWICKDPQASSMVSHASLTTSTLSWNSKRKT